MISVLFVEFLIVMIFLDFSVDFIFAVLVEDDFRVLLRAFSLLSEDSRRAFFGTGEGSVSTGFVGGNGRVRLGGVLKTVGV